MRLLLIILVLTVVVGFGGAATVVLRHDLMSKNRGQGSQHLADETARVAKPLAEIQMPRKPAAVSSALAPSDPRLAKAVADARENFTPPAKSKEERKIFDVYPDISRQDPMELLGRLAVTEFRPQGEAEFEGGDEQFQNYKYSTQNNEEVVRWDWSDDGNVAVEQVNYSPDERVIRRYFDHTGEMSEVSYEYGGRGGLMRFNQDGTVESYQTWNGSGANTLVRYGTGGSTQEVWSLDGSDWKQVF